MNVLKNISISAGLLLASIAGGAQEQSKHEINIHAGSGLSTFKYSMNAGTQHFGWGGSGGLGYTCFFSESFGVGTGVGATYYNASINADGTTARLELTDNYGDDFVLNTILDRYRENQNLLFLDIPLYLQFQSRGKHRFYLLGGGKFSIPLISSFDVKNAAISNSAYYAYLDNTLYAPNFRGLGSFTERNFDGKVSLKNAYMLIAETGIKWQISKTISIYTGIYIDYGLNDIRNESLTSFIQPPTAQSADFKTNSLLVSQHSSGKGFVESIKPFAAGLNIRLAINGKTQSQDISYPDEIFIPAEPEPEVKPEPEPEIAVEPVETVEPVESAKPVEKPVIKEKEPLKLQSICDYDIAMANLTPARLTILEKNIEIMKANPEIKVICEGHTCDLGTDGLNIKIAKKRAEVVFDYMVSQGIAPERLSVSYKGEVEPKHPNTTVENRYMNRRVEFIVVENGEHEVQSSVSQITDDTDDTDDTNDTNDADTNDTDDIQNNDTQTDAPTTANQPDSACSGDGPAVQTV
jgi:outer membrane protein OmpA-like peptidoglycan-associated protein